MAVHPPSIPYPAIERHGVIGDRGTAALVAADGTLDWLCLPDYDGTLVFGALLDAGRGARWRLGPARASQGRQRYEAESAILATTWTGEDSELELTDAMAWPGDVRPGIDPGRRVLVRRLRSVRGNSEVCCTFRPRSGFDAVSSFATVPDGLAFRVGELVLSLWGTPSFELNDGVADAAFRLAEGDEAWFVLDTGDSPGSWSAEHAREVLHATAAYWSDAASKLTYAGPRAERVRRSALTVHLLSYAPTGSLVAAPTTSLPERIGGDWNADYRYAWVRDASLSLAVLALLGDTAMAGRYMDWLVGLDSSTDAPLQVLYGIKGETVLTQHERTDLDGYRGSRPVRFGNHAYRQTQLDSLGYFNDCALVYLQQGGPWREEYWLLVRRIAEHVSSTWRRPDNGIWELSQFHHHVSSKVMAWVALERAIKIADRLGRLGEAAPWRPVMEEIHAEVMDRGWSERLGAFRQHYESDSLDASTLLIAVMGFLPSEHPRVLATADAIARTLAIDGFVHRFDPRSTFPDERSPLGEYEGAFLPCTFWLATTYAQAGRTEEAEAILGRAESVAGDLGLFAEGVDTRTGSFLGNTPLLFSQIEYIRAVMELAKARPLDMARMMVGTAARKIGRALGGGE